MCLRIRYILVIFLFPIVCGICLYVLANVLANDNDLLAYSIPSADGTRTIMLYDPSRRMSRIIFSAANLHQFTSSFSINGHIAFILRDELGSQIYVLDALSPESSPINLSERLNLTGYPLDWSLDGRYLAFVSYGEQNQFIHVWDSETDTAVNITPENLLAPASGYDVAWSPDGRLAFTAWFDFARNDQPEIYLWDGNTTSNLSQNPAGEDRDPVWNQDGTLAFWSQRSGEGYGFFIWDGVSVVDGRPDATSFAFVSVNLNPYITQATWTYDGRLSFSAASEQETRAQTYVWDGQTATNISRNPDYHYGIPVWSRDGYWAVTTFFRRHNYCTFAIPKTG